MKSLLIIFTIAILVPEITLGQTAVKDSGGLLYQIIVENDTIEYLKFTQDSDQNKPIILFLQGSLPKPLIFDFGNFRHVNIPFEYKIFLEEFDIVVISMPHTPVIAPKNKLNSQYCYIIDSTNQNSFHNEYLKGNELENYVKRTNHIISELSKKSPNIHLIGHSQGAKIASVVASKNKELKTVSLLGFNPFGRFDELIRREREKLNSKMITDEEYRKKLDILYGNWIEVNQTPKDFLKGHNSWTTFSIDYTSYLLDIEIPIFIGYGTDDIIAENCDLHPIKFIEKNKNNYTLRPYVGLNHDFFKVVNGKPDYKNGKRWTNVIEDIIKWSKE